MKPITKEEFAARYPSEELTATSEEEFSGMAATAADLTDVLCFGRASRDEAAAGRAMVEMIRYWIERGGYSAATRAYGIEREAVGNYSVSYTDRDTVTLHGLAVAPAALIILDRAGLRNRNV